MSQKSSKTTMDISPWPGGQGFQGANAWWEYVLQQEEQNRLDFLLMAALLNTDICNLLLKHDKALLKAFELSDETIARFSQLEAQTLEEFVQIMLESNPDLSKA